MNAKGRVLGTSRENRMLHGMKRAFSSTRLACGNSWVSANSSRFLLLLSSALRARLDPSGVWCHSTEENPYDIQTGEY